MRGARKMVVCVGIAAALAGCASFENISTILDLRILGIMAEPPEIYVDPAALNTQTDAIHTDFTALVVDANGAGRAISYGVLACPREIDTVTAATGRNGVVCAHNVPGMTPSSLEVIPPDMPAATPDGEGPVHAIGFPVDVPPPLLGAAFMLDPYGAQGFQLPVVVQIELAAGGQSIVATKRMIFSQQLPDRPAQTPNQNPLPAGVTVYPVRDGNADPIDPMDLAEDQDMGVPLGGQLWFEPVGTVAEAYSTRTLTRDVPPRVVTTDVAAETLRFAFFATAGTFTPAETSTVRSLLRDQERAHLESQYTAPSVMPPDGKVLIWIVAHDERGGTSFTPRHLIVGDP